MTARSAFSRTEFKYGGLLLLAAVFCSVLFGGGKVGAVSNWAPDGGDYTDGGGVYLEVSDPGAFNGLDATRSAVTIYSLIPNPTITILSPDHCSGGAIDSNAPGPIGWDTTFIFGGAAQLYPNGSGPGGINSIQPSPGCDGGTWVTPLSGLGAVNIAGTTYYVATLSAQIRGGTGGVNAFKVITNSGYVSFRTPNEKFALQNRAGSRSRGSYSYGDFYIKFGPDCSITSPYVTNLTSFDDDQGDGAQDNGAAFGNQIWYELREFDSNGNPTGNNVSNGLGGYGGGRLVNMPVVIRPFHNYQWIWHNVSSGNGIQFQMPAFTDQIYSVTRCNQPWSLSSNTTANRANMYPGEVVRFNYDLRNNGPGTASFQYVTRVQEYFSGVAQPVQSWPTPNAVEPGLAPGASVVAYSARDHTAPLNPALTRICSWIEYAGRSSSDGTPAASNQACVNVSPVTPTCGPWSITPSALDPSMPFTATVRVDFNSQPAAAIAYSTGGRLFVRVTGPAGYNQLRTIDLGSPSLNYIAGSAAYPAVPVGTYIVTYGIQGGTVGNISCGGTAGTSFDVGYHPYFRVEGGDAVAGADFLAGTATVCTPNTTAGFIGWNKGTPTFFGAGAQLGAMALGSLAGFPTSTNTDGTSSGVANATRTGLAFANDTAPVGSFGAFPCLPDYASKAAASAGATTMTGSSVDLSTLASGVYIYSNDVTITASSSLANDRHITIVIAPDGSGNGNDAIINTDIRYANYANIARAPQFQLLVQNGGNIYVLNTVQQLHGAYVAQTRTGTGGVFVTCFDGTSPSIDPVLCNRQLTVFGSVTVGRVVLGRTYGNLNAVAGVPARPAEIFHYTPELWAAQSNPTEAEESGFDAITSLPPIL
jgi:hypothetical protein